LFEGDWLRRYRDDEHHPGTVMKLYAWRLTAAKRISPHLKFRSAMERLAGRKGVEFMCPLSKSTTSRHGCNSNAQSPSPQTSDIDPVAIVLRLDANTIERGKVR
jgi:hypothetical protein